MKRAAVRWTGGGVLLSHVAPWEGGRAIAQAEEGGRPRHWWSPGFLKVTRVWKPSLRGNLRDQEDLGVLEEGQAR